MTSIPLEILQRLKLTLSERGLQGGGRIGSSVSAITKSRDLTSFNSRFFLKSAFVQSHEHKRLGIINRVCSESRLSLTTGRPEQGGCEAIDLSVIVG